MTDFYIPWGGNLPRLFIDRNGDVMGGATLSAYKARTTTPINMYDGINGDVIGDEVTVSDGDNAGYIERDEVSLTSADTVVDVTADAPTLLGVVDLPEDGSWSLVGNLANLSDSLGAPSTTGLTGTRIALASRGLNVLNAYDFDGADWSLSATKDLGSISYSALATLSSTRVALVDGIEPRELRAYDLAGGTFSQVGNALAISGLGSRHDIDAMSATRIVLIDEGNDELRVYDFDNTDWSQTGNGLTVNNSGASVAAMNSTDVAVYNSQGGGELFTYRFDGADFTQVGNSGQVGTPGTNPSRTQVVSLFGNYVALVDDEVRQLQTWHFDGTDWAQVGNGLSVGSVDADAYSLAALSPTEVAYIGNFDEELGFYRFS